MVKLIGIGVVFAIGLIIVAMWSDTKKENNENNK